jgi:hypothetical protein
MNTQTSWAMSLIITILWMLEYSGSRFIFHRSRPFRFSFTADASEDWDGMDVRPPGRGSDFVHTFGHHLDGSWSKMESATTETGRKGSSAKAKRKREGA